jgi:putative MATE family efflux protein
MLGLTAIYSYIRYSRSTQKRRGKNLTRAEIKTRGIELAKISLPMAIEHISVSVMGMVSMMLVSQAGQHAAPALGMVDAVTQLILALFAALTTGGTIVVAQYVGRRDTIAAKTAGGQAIVLSAVFSLVMFGIIAIFRNQILNALFAQAEPAVMEASRTFLTIVNFSYPIVAVTLTMFGLIRGSGDTFAPMVISVFMNVINLILGVLLIPIFAVQGAAWALVIAKFCGLAASSWFLIKKAKGIRLNKLAYFKPDFSRQKTILRLGLPTSFESGLFQAGRLVTAVIVVSMSTAAMAANTIGFTLVNFINVPGVAFSTGAMILVGQRIGRGEEKDVVRTTMFSIAAGSIFFLILGIILLAARNPIFALFNPGDDTLSYLPVLFISYLALAPLLWTSSFGLPACLRATGDVVYPMAVSVSSMLLMRLLFSYILGILLGMGVIGVWIAMYMDWIVRSIFFYARLISGKWKGRSIK